MDGLDEMIPVREGRLGRGEFGLRDGEGDGGWEGLDVGYVYELDCKRQKPSAENCRFN